MATEAQINANRQNALKAGVKTDAGKAVSKYNALRHGVLQKTLIATEQVEAQTILTSLIREYQPQGIVESLLIESAVLAYMRKQRAIQAEKAFLTQGMMPIIRFDGDDGKDTVEFIQVGNSEYETMDKTYMRYITGCERQFYRALHELQRVQELRKGRRPSSFAIDVIRDSADD